TEVRRDLQLRADAHLVQVQDALDRAQAYTASHPHPTLGEIERMNELNGETNRLMTEQNALVMALVAGPADRHSAIQWTTALAAVLPAGWLVHRVWLRARTLERRQKNLCVAC